MHPKLQAGVRQVTLAIPQVRRLVKQRDRAVTQKKEAQVKLRRMRAQAQQQEKCHERELAGLRREVVVARDELAGLEKAVGQWPPGHYYSPIPDLEDVRQRQDAIWTVPRGLPGIDVNVDGQLRLLESFREFYPEQPFGDAPTDGLRYCFKNRFFSYGDGLALYGMLRHLRPARLVEVGSGWSSALVLDVVDRFLAGNVRCTFIEPFPDRLHELLTPQDVERVEILTKPLNEVDPKLFTGLEPGDILLIDSTHVSRIGSDVNQLVHEVLPILPPGVHVHVHDIFWPFEYPKSWVFGGRAWNEAYLLRAYLTQNPHTEITWFNHYLETFHAEEVTAAMPLWAANPGGSLWFVTR